MASSLVEPYHELGSWPQIDACFMLHGDAILKMSNMSSKPQQLRIPHCSKGLERLLNDKTSKYTSVFTKDDFLHPTVLPRWPFLKC